MKGLISGKMGRWFWAVLAAVIFAGCNPVDDELPTQPPQEPNPQQPVDPTL